MKQILFVIALILGMGAYSVQAEDPLLGVVHAIKCINCVPDSVVLQVDDPIDNQEIEVKIPTREYNKVLIPLQGRRLFNKPEEGCLYWQEKIKPAATGKAGSTKGTVVNSDSTKTDSLAVVNYRQSPCIPYTSTSMGIH